MNRDDFLRWFNRDFWKAFRRWSSPLQIPPTKEDKVRLVNRVFEAVQSAQYSPSVPKIEIVSNKGMGVARYIPVFCIEDYCVYYFCLKELEEVLCHQRVTNTVGGWTLLSRTALASLQITTFKNMTDMLSEYALTLAVFISDMPMTKWSF